MISQRALLSFSAAISLALIACTGERAGEPAANDSAASMPDSQAQVNAAAAATAVGAPTGGICDGIAGVQCASPNDFCKKPGGQCGTADAQGKCTPKPEICSKEYIPVCGCDGKTYGNACEADAAGVSVDAPGECKPAQQ